MEFNPVFKRRLVKRRGFVTVSIPPQLAELFGECVDVTIRANLSGSGLIIEPLDESKSTALTTLTTLTPE
jgi:hypothetical protein